MRTYYLINHQCLFDRVFIFTSGKKQGFSVFVKSQQRGALTWAREEMKYWCKDEYGNKFPFASRISRDQARKILGAKNWLLARSYTAPGQD